MICTHCKGTTGNELVVMEDNSLHCYTCGRLKAELSSRRVSLYDLSIKAIRERKNKYGS